MSGSTLNLLLVSEEDEPVLPTGLGERAVTGFDKPTDLQVRGRQISDSQALADDVARQGWGVLVPDTPEGDALLTAAAPLIEARAMLTGRQAVLRVPAGAALSAQEARLWREQNYDPLPAWERPSYLLLLGDLHQVSENLHRTLGDCFIGRLAFSNPDGSPDLAAYTKYAEKVLDWESRSSESPSARARLFAVADGTEATKLGASELLEPLFDLITQAGAAHFPDGDLNPRGASALREKSDFLSAVRGGDPTVLFTISHGLGAPSAGWSASELARQRQVQGAMSFGARTRRLLGSELLSEASFLPGGVWFMLACYGAGTPSSSRFSHWLQHLHDASEAAEGIEAVLRSLPQPSERPFIAALPQAALAHREGPLAFIGHLDLAWTYSFLDRDTGSERRRPQAFFELVRSLLRRSRVGVALTALRTALLRTNSLLSELYDTAAQTGTAPPPASLGHLWMLRQDLAGYILLGDPAVQLPGACPQVSPNASPASGIARRERPSTAALPATLPLPLDQLEEAILHLMAGELGAAAIARKYGVSRFELERLARLYRQGGVGVLPKIR